ncbi:MAG TPA: GNAT family N-acetyltransferase [Gaiellales bacterium]
MNVISADTLGATELVELFNAGFSDYFVPMQLDEAALREHLEGNDIELRDSPVVVAARPAAFALLGVRGADAWVGGMATIPDQRRRGHGERALLATLEAAAARGCRTVWLEVVEDNRAASTLYAKLGFETVRDLVVWSLPATAPGTSSGHALDARAAQAWIAANRPSHEPWQRADAVLDRLHDRGAPLHGLAVERAGAIAGAIVCRDGATLSVLQAAAVDAVAAAEVLLAAAAGERDVRFTNAPSDEPFSQALEQLGGRLVARQHEMRLGL